MSQRGVPVWDISDPFPGQHHQGTEDDENGYRPRKFVIVHMEASILPSYGPHEPGEPYQSESAPSDR